MARFLVGTGRFELPTPRTPSECSTRLSHVPTGFEPGVRTGLTHRFYTTMLPGPALIMGQRASRPLFFSASLCEFSASSAVKSFFAADVHVSASVLPTTQTEFSFPPDQCDQR